MSFAKTLGVLRFAPVTMLCYEPLGNPLILKALVILANDRDLIGHEKQPDAPGRDYGLG